MTQLAGRVVWVTGAGTGIGEASARRLAEDGATVVLSGRREPPLQSVAEAIRGAGGSAEVAVLDIAKRSAVFAAVERIVDRHGRLDALVNSAGLNVTRRNWHNLSAEDWETVVQVDLNGAFYCAKAVLPVMKGQRDGVIVNVSSWAGKYVNVVTGPAYSTAKHALNAMTESINMESCLHGVRACALSPGEVATPILDTRPIPPTQEDRDRMIQPEDMARIIAFVVCTPRHVCINELTVSATWNRAYVGGARMVEQLE